MKRILVSTAIIALASLVSPLAAVAQRSGQTAEQPRRAQQPSTTPGAAPDLAAQIAELRAAIVRLESSIGAGQPSGSATLAPSGMQGMGGMKGGMMGRKPADGGMRGGMGKGGAGGMKGGMMDDEMGGMSPTASAGSAGGMSGMEGMDSAEMGMEMGMMGMGSMGQQAGSNLSGLRVSSLPGFPGASHIYHIGATGFFLDHPDHVSLDTAQQQELNRLKQGALLAKASTQRKINEAEQELWELTAADEPDAQQIKAKVDQIANLRAQQRLDFIRAVGEGAKVLTDEQRNSLLGTAADKPNTHTGH